MRVAVPWRACRSAVLAALLWLATTSSADAQSVTDGPRPLDPAVVAVIDYQRLMRESAAAVSIRAQVESRRDGYEAQLLAERERLAEADRALDQERDKLSTEAYRDKRRAFEGEVAALQRLVQERRSELDEASGAAFQKVRDAVVEIIGDLGNAYEFNVVLPRSQVLVFAPEIDLTAEVMAALNARLPDVRIHALED